MNRGQVCGVLLNAVSQMMAGPSPKAKAAPKAQDAGADRDRRRRGRRRVSSRGSRSRSSRKSNRRRACHRGRGRGGRSDSHNGRSSDSYSSSDYSSNSPPLGGSAEYSGKFWAGSRLLKSCRSYKDMPEKLLQEALHIVDPQRFSH